MLQVETAGIIFRNHPTNEGLAHPQHITMIELNKNVEKLHNDFKLRMTGENGVMKIFITFLNNLDIW